MGEYADFVRTCRNYLLCPECSPYSSDEHEENPNISGPYEILHNTVIRLTFFNEFGTLCSFGVKWLFMKNSG